VTQDDCGKETAAERGL